MSRNMLRLLAVLALVTFASFSFAQNAPKTARQAGDIHQKGVPSTVDGCHKCFAYGGDLDPNSALANGLASEKDVIVSDAEVVWAVVIPSGGATVNRLVANFLTIGCVSDPQQADWDIRSGVSSGNGGTVIASGTNQSFIGSTGRTAFGLLECRVEVDLPSPMTLSAGTYFFGVVPYCTNTGNNTCLSQRFFLSDSPDMIPLNAQGNVPANDSFFNSSFFGTNFQQTWGPSGSCGQIGCNRFSAGLR
jgi:hypothetical protein